MTKDFSTAALDYHALPKPGKTAVVSTKPTETQEDLSLCYTPGVAEPVKSIAAEPHTAYTYTNKGNLVGILTNGTAVLGLGHTGALSSKPVMEGKAVLFKRFADIDAFDIEIDCDNPTSLIETITHIAPTFGAINLEDIKAPDCFIIEETLCEKLNIPVFHDDQHGTAIVVAAGLLNALDLQNKVLANAKIVCAGAGAAGIATMRLLIKLGAQKENLLLVDRAGVVHTHRKDINNYKKQFAVETSKHSLADALVAADVFIGVSGPDVMTAQMLQTMAAKPIVFALSNPTPEIMPEIAKRVRQDIVMATGRSDYPNQVNNALCFPYIFRGALDVHATRINQEMCIAAVHALRDLAREPVPAVVLAAYSQIEPFQFDANYILPKLLDPRLKEKVSTAVANAAIASGVAQLEKAKRHIKF